MNTDKIYKGQKVNRCFKDKELVAVSLIVERIGLALSISETRDSTTSSLIRCCVVQSFPTGTLLYWEQVY